MKAVRTVEEKQDTLKRRQEEQRDLGKHIDKLISEGRESHDAVSMGCGGRGVLPSICRMLSRIFGISHRVGAVSTKESTATECAPVGAHATSKRAACGSDISRAVLGLAPSKKSTPRDKLAAATDAMKARVASLETRAAECRTSAQTQVRAGNKAAAMRELKRSKALERQSASTQSAIDSLEAQSDMLEQTALQKEVAAALGATAATLKKEKGLLSKAENAVDAAHELRDMHDDLTHAMSGIADATYVDFDDDDLMAELDKMAGGGDDGSASSGTVVTEEGRVEGRVKKEENGQSEQLYNEMEARRQAFPAVPRSRVDIEKQGLLAQ